jgi:hypothetical protein
MTLNGEEVRIREKQQYPIPRYYHTLSMEIIRKPMVHSSEDIQ